MPVAACGHALEEAHALGVKTSIHPLFSYVLRDIGLRATALLFSALRCSGTVCAA
jgi:hypothetical protein